MRAPARAETATDGGLSSRDRGGFCPRFFVEGHPACLGTAESEVAPGVEVTLGPEDSHHALRVLRVREGDRCEVVMPSGRAYAAQVSAATDPLRVEVVSLLTAAAAGAAYRTPVGVVQALARPSVMDYAIEKGTEVGASFFLVVPAAGSPRLRKEAATDRLRRWRKIAREAAKQSRQTVVPTVDAAASVADGVDRIARSGAMMVILDPGAGDDLRRVLRAMPDLGASSGRESSADQMRALALWVGPEGGWTDAEVGLILAKGAAAARLGRGVLRTETAGPVGVAVARLELADW